MNKIKLTGLLIIIILSSFKQTDIAYTKITKQGISLEYPSNWDVMDVVGSVIIVKEKAISERYSVLTNFAVEIDKNYNSIKEYSKYWKDKMSKNKHLSNWILLSEKKLKYKGFKAKEFICTYQIGSFKVKTKVIIVVINDKIFNINTTSSEENFDNRKTTINKIYNSVKFDS